MTGFIAFLIHAHCPLGQTLVLPSLLIFVLLPIKNDSEGKPGATIKLRLSDRFVMGSNSKIASLYISICLPHAMILFHTLHNQKPSKFSHSSTRVRQLSIKMTIYYFAYHDNWFIGFELQIPANASNCIWYLTPNYYSQENFTRASQFLIGPVFFTSPFPWIGCGPKTLLNSR